MSPHIIYLEKGFNLAKLKLRNEDQTEIPIGIQIVY